MINVLAIGLDYLMLQNMKYRGDVIARQFEYAKNVNEINHVIYSPNNLSLEKSTWGDNIHIYPTSSRSKALFFFDAIRECQQILSNKKIDMITAEDPFVTGLVGYVLKRQYGIPLNVQIHVDFCDNEYWINNEIENKIFNRLAKWIVKRADTIRIGTSYEKNKLVKLEVSPDKIAVIPVHCDLGKFEKGDGAIIRKQLLENKFRYLLFTAARITSQKDLPTMINAMKIVVERCPEALLVIAGDGPDREKIEKLILLNNLGSNIKMLGAIDHNAIPDYFAACDLYLISSIFEGTCITLVEASAAGKCVVASKFAGTYDLVEDEKTGMLFDIGDYKSLALNILLLLDIADLRLKIGNAAKLKVNNYFSHEKNILELISLWEKTANATGGTEYK